MSVIQGTLRVGDQLAIINGGKYYPLGIVSDIIIDGIGTVASATNKIDSLYVMVSTGVNIGMHVGKDTIIWVVIPIKVKCIMDVYPSDVGMFFKIAGGSFEVGDELSTISKNQIVHHGKIQSLTIMDMKPWEDMVFMINLQDGKKLEPGFEQAVVLYDRSPKCILDIKKNDIEGRYYVSILKGTLAIGDILASRTGGNLSVLGRVIDIQLHDNSLTSIHRTAVPLKIKLSTGVVVGMGLEELVVLE
jgi:hypothetical protein